MLPASLTTPIAAILALGGFLACFAGYRLFRLVLGIFGFLLGAFVTTSFMGTSDMWALAVAAIVGGVLGAALMVVAYFIGVGLIGAGLAALVVNLGWRLVGGVPPTWLLVVACVLGALLALSVVRYVVVLGTSITGAWTLIVGVLALVGDPEAMTAASSGDVWMFYPLDPVPNRWWYTVLWVILFVVGAAVQLSTTSRTGRRRGARRLWARAA